MEQIESVSLIIPKADPSPAVSSWLDEPGCPTTTRTPVVTVINQMENLTPSLCLAPKRKRKLTKMKNLRSIWMLDNFETEIVMVCFSFLDFIVCNI